MSKDLQIIPAESVESVDFRILGSRQDDPVMLLQRLYVLLFSNSGTGYRDGDGTGALLDYMAGGNTPEKQELDSLLVLACAEALDRLDQEDRDIIESFTGEASEDGVSIQLELVLTDGTVIRS